jgi:hypothetical protein
MAMLSRFLGAIAVLLIGVFAFVAVYTRAV